MNKMLCIVSALCVMNLHADWATDTLGGMTLDQKIGQMCVATINTNDTSAVNKAKNLIGNNGIGGVVLESDSEKTLITPADKKVLIDAMQQLASIPLFIIQDMEVSLTKQLESSGSGAGLDLIPDHRLIGVLGRSVGACMKALGVNMLLTPVISVDATIRNKLTGGSGTINPRELARRGFAFVQGLKQEGMIMCAKHFPSGGNGNVDPHIALPIMFYSRAVLDRGELELFKELITVGIDGIMASHIYIPAFDEAMQTPASLLPSVVTDLLQTELGYTGLVVTDELEIRTKTLKYTSGEFIVAAFDAGHDLVLGIDDISQAINALSDYVKNNADRLAEVDRRVLKILQLKSQLVPA